MAACLSASFSACHRPVALFQRSPREIFHSPQATRPPTSPPDSVVPATPNVPAQNAPVAYADARPLAPTSATERVQRRLQRTLTMQPMAAVPTRTNVPAAIWPGPGPKEKQRKTLRERLGLPPRKKLNWWQRIPWQLKAASVVTLVAVGFALLGITVLAIVFGIIGAFLLVRGLKRSFKVRRGLFG